MKANDITYRRNFLFNKKCRVINLDKLIDNPYIKICYNTHYAYHTNYMQTMIIILYMRL